MGRIVHRRKLAGLNPQVLENGAIAFHGSLPELLARSDLKRAYLWI